MLCLTVLHRRMSVTIVCAILATYGIYIKADAQSVDQGVKPDTEQKSLRDTSYDIGDEKWLETPEGMAYKEERQKNYPLDFMSVGEWVENDPRGQEFWDEYRTGKRSVRQSEAFIADIAEYGYEDAVKRQGHFTGRLRRWVTDLSEFPNEVKYRSKTGYYGDAFRQYLRQLKGTQEEIGLGGLGVVGHGLVFAGDILVGTVRGVVEGLAAIAAGTDDLGDVLMIIAPVAFLVYFVRRLDRLVKRRTKQQNGST